MKRLPCLREKKGHCHLLRDEDTIRPKNCLGNDVWLQWQQKLPHRSRSYHCISVVFKIKFSKKAHLRLRYHRFHTHTDAENKKHAFSFFHEELRSLYGYGIARVGWLDAPRGGIHANPCSKICKAGFMQILAKKYTLLSMYRHFTMRKFIVFYLSFSEPYTSPWKHVYFSNVAWFDRAWYILGKILLVVVASTDNRPRYVINKCPKKWAFSTKYSKINENMAFFPLA